MYIVDLLDQKDIAACLLDLLTEVQNVSLLLLQDLVDLSVIIHDNLIVHLIFVNNSAHLTSWLRDGKISRQASVDSVGTESVLFLLSPFALALPRSIL